MDYIIYIGRLFKTNLIIVCKQVNVRQIDLISTRSLTDE